MKYFDGGITFSKSLRVVGGISLLIYTIDITDIILIVYKHYYINVCWLYLCITSVFSFDPIGIDNKYYVTRRVKYGLIWFSIHRFFKTYQTRGLNTQHTHILYKMYTNKPH